MRPCVCLSAGARTHPLLRAVPGTASSRVPARSPEPVYPHGNPEPVCPAWSTALSALPVTHLRAGAAASRPVSGTVLLLMLRAKAGPLALFHDIPPGMELQDTAL